MTKIIVGFTVLFCAFFFGIDIFRSLTKREKISLLKMLSYSIFCSLLVIMFVATIVLLF